MEEKKFISEVELLKLEKSALDAEVVKNQIQLLSKDMQFNISKSATLKKEIELLLADNSIKGFKLKDLEEKLKQLKSDAASLAKQVAQNHGISGSWGYDPLSGEIKTKE